MKVLVTCGASYEPIDRVRRLTNFSTGELGTILTEELAVAGFEVICCLGEGASFSPPPSVKIFRFGTNDDLEKIIRELSVTDEIAAVFHVAALCDFKIQKIEDHDGNVLSSAKINSQLSNIRLILEPATKLISKFRQLFPQALLIGWKYEMDSSSEEAIEKGMRQITENKTDACIVNGAAYGEGFGFCRFDHPIKHLKNKKSLSEFLSNWLRDEMISR